MNREKTFEDAKQLCKVVGGEIAAPLSDFDIREWLMVCKTLWKIVHMNSLQQDCI